MNEFGDSVLDVMSLRYDLERATLEEAEEHLKNPHRSTTKLISLV